MKQLAPLVVAAMLLGGCVSPDVAPSRDDIAKLAEVRVIPLEAPPLAVPPASGVLIQGIGASPLARGANVVGTVLLFLQMPEISARTGEVSRSLQAALDGKGIWVPTVALANETQAQLVARGLQATATAEVKRLHGLQDRSYTMLMENWLAPIRAWYNDEDPVPDYRRLGSGQRVYVLEVGVINYEITASRLLLQVAMKLIDASDGRVLGRARAGNAWTMPNLNPLDQAFANDAARFKQAFGGAARDLVRECMVSLGLLPCTTRKASRIDELRDFERPDFRAGGPVTYMNRLHGLTLASLAAMISGCIVFPVPSKDESVASGSAFAEDQVKAMISDAGSAAAIKSRLGAPLVDLGPERVFVYGWIAKQGAIGWMLVWPYGVAGGTEPWAAANLLIVAFDAERRVLKAGTVEYSPRDTMSGQVRRWLSANGLAAQVSSPRPDGIPQGGSKLIIYRPSTSACAFPLFDSATFKLKIAVDGRIVGDLTKGEYLAFEIGPSARGIGIESYSNFFLTMGKRYSRTTLDITAEPNHTTYIDAYICTGTGRVQTYAAVRDAATALKAMHELQSAW